MATASWLDPTTRQARLWKKNDLLALPHTVHKLEAQVVAKMRWEGCAFIRTVGTNLKMFKPALSSACVFFTRFYARNGFQDKKPTEWSDSEWQEWRQAQLPSRFKGDLHWRFVALACLFLAGKVEDNPKKIYDVVNQFYADVPKREMLVDPEISDKHIRELKETLFAYERLVMQELDFDMIVEAPIAFNQVAQYISFMRTSLHTAARSPIAGLPVMSAPDDPAILDPDTLQIVGLALEFMENSLLTTLWLEYDAPTIALGIAWLTAKFYDYAPDMQGWWQFMNERFEDVNKREDPQTGNVFRMEAPSQEVLDDIGLQLMQYHSEALPRGKPYVPPLPDLNSGLAEGLEGGDISDCDLLPFSWRYVCFTDTESKGESKKAGGSKRPPPTVLEKEGNILRCTCPVWKGLATTEMPEEKRTCRCLTSFFGLASERQRVGEEHAEASHRLASLQSYLKRPKVH